MPSVAKRENRMDPYWQSQVRILSRCVHRVAQLVEHQTSNLEESIVRLAGHDLTSSTLKDQISGSQGSGLKGQSYFQSHGVSGVARDRDNGRPYEAVLGIVAAIWRQTLTAHRAATIPVETPSQCAVESRVDGYFYREG